MTDAATYAQMINEVKAYRNEAPTYSAEDIEKYKSGEYPWTHPNTDWFKETFRALTNTGHLHSELPRFKNIQIFRIVRNTI